MRTANNLNKANQNCEEDDEYLNENICLYDEAQIGDSHGKDGDYTFGYPIEELENVL